MGGMAQDLLSEVEDFMARTGLSEHRTGIILARNGRLVERLRSRRRVWPETAAEIRVAMRSELKRRISEGAAE